MSIKYDYKYLINNINLLNNNYNEEQLLFFGNHIEGSFSLENGELPIWLRNISKIDNYAFAWLENLTSITIPNSVIWIGNRAFWRCSNLSNIYLYPTTPPALGGIDSFSTDATTTIHVPVGCGDAYKTATNWSNFADIIVEDIVIE